MIKNTAGQKVGAQLISTTDGSSVTTGTCTVYVTLDAVTQATGTVGSGAATHEGNGYWTYAPSQAETNGDLCAFTFVHSSAVDTTVQVYTQTSVTHWLGTAVATPTVAGVPEVDVTHYGGTAGTFSSGVPSVALGNVAHGGTGATLTLGTSSGNTVTINNTGAGAALRVANNGSGAAASIYSDVSAGIAISAPLGYAIDNSNGVGVRLNAMAITGNLTAGNITTGGTLAVTGNLSAGNIAAPIVGDITGNLSGSVGSVTGAVGSVTGNVGGSVASVSGAVGSVSAGVTLAASAVDAIWDEATSGHATAGTTGKALTDAGSAGDPWSTDIQAGGYSGNQAGAVVYTNLDTTISSRGTYDGGDITGNLSGSVGSVTGAVGSVTGAVGSVTGNVAGVTGNVGGSVASVSGAVGSVSAGVTLAASAVDAIWDEATSGHATAGTTGKALEDIRVDTGTTLPATLAGLNDISVADVLTTQMTESYAADGTAPTLAQALFLIQQTIGDFSIAGTTITVKQLDGSTTAATYTLDDGTTPTSRTRTT